METTTLRKSWSLWLLFVVITALVHYVSFTSGDREFCYKGRFLAIPTAAGGSKYCMSCAPGTFIPDEIHNHTKCFPCTRVLHPKLERLITPCNKSHDTVIHCIDGYYWPISPWPDKRATCMKCKNCSVIQSPCQKFQNTRCCPGDKYEVRINATGQPVCVQLCEAGQFLNSVDDQCVTCIEGTYMDEDRHINQYCKTCAVPTSPHEKVVRPCTSTQSSVIGCVDGFYRQRQSGDSPVDVCVPCSNCSHNRDADVYEGQPCGEWKDTVCCPQSSISVILTSDGPKCVTTVCAEGEFLTEDLTSCQSCPTGTYLNETRQSNHECQSCRNHPVARHCLDHQAQNECTDGITCGGIVGILIGIFVLSGLGIAVGIFLCTRRRYRKAPAGHYEDTTVTSAQDNARFPLLGGYFDYPGTSNNVISVKPESILLNNFSSKNLPETYRRDEQFAALVLDMIKHLAELTVHLIVPESSQNRCQNFRRPDAGKGHTGCGWIGQVKRFSRVNGSFPPDFPEGDHGDAVSGTPVAEIVVCTAARVVFDIQEGRQTTCVFSDETKLKGAKKVVSDQEKDWCYMIFETNDKNLIETLEKNCEQFNKLRCEVLFKFDIVRDPYESEILSKKLDSLHLFTTLLTNIEDVSRDTAQTAGQKSLTDFGRRLNLESLGLCKLIANNENDVVKSQSILEMIKDSEGLARCKRSIEKIEKLKNECQKFTPGSTEEGNAQQKYRKWLLEAATLGRSLHLFKYVFVHHWGHEDTPKYPKYDYRYSPNHPFTIITTFKDDKSTGAAVKLGQVTLRKSMWFDHHSIYCYTNPTEPGDEGAPVLVMGNKVLHCHGHSGTLGRTSESGAWSDLIPCIANLSGSTPVANERT